jgi:hypothetical protein
VVKAPAKKASVKKKKTARKKAAKKATAAKKTAAQKASAKKAAVKKTTARKAAARRTTAKKTTAKKAPAKKVAAKKAAATKAAAKKATAKKATAKKATAKKATAKKATAKKAAARKTPAKKAAARKVAAKKAPARKKAAPRKAATRKATPLAARGRRRGSQEPAAPGAAVPGLSEEDQIRSSKYLPRDLREPLFEEERFLFPESYGVNRVRLLVRDPEWVFAYWDVSAETMKGLAQSLGKRAFALSRLTLRVLDPVSGGSSDILLPPGARWWYIRTDTARRTYRAEIGITLPSGEFRRLAESNAVVTPRVGPSRERAQRRLSYAGAGAVAPEEAAAAGRADREDLTAEPWAGEDTDATDAGPRGGASESFRPERPGASDTARPGASDTMRPGASDTHRR